MPVRGIRMSSTKWVLLAVLLISLALRLYRLGDKPVWFDEAVSVSHAEQALPAYFSSPRIDYKPVFFFLLHFWIRLFGEGPSAMRLFPVIWGVLSVLLIYKTGKIAFGRRTGMIAAFLLAISVFHIFHSQQLRQFSFLTFLSLFCIFCLLRCLQKGGKVWFVLFSAANILVMFTHPYGICMPFLEAAYLIFIERIRPDKKWALSFGSIAVFLALWFLIPNKASIKEMTWWIPPPGWRDFLEVITTMSFGGPRYGLDDFRIWGGSRYWMPFSAAHRNIYYFSFVLAALYSFLFAKGIFAKKEGQNVKHAVLFLLWFIFPIAAAAALSAGGIIQVFSIKHMIIVLPGFLLLIAKGIDSCPSVFRKISILAIILLSILPLRLMYSNYFGIDWKSGAELVKSQAEPGDAVVIYSLMEVVPFMYYFRGHAPSLADIDIYGQNFGGRYRDAFVDNGSGVYIAGIKQSEFGDIRVSAESHFASQLRKMQVDTRARVWLMISRWTDPRVSRMIRKYLYGYFPKAECVSLQGLIVCRYSR